MTALECDMELVSGSMKVAVRGAGPLGKFTATVSNFSVKGRGEHKREDRGGGRVFRWVGGAWKMEGKGGQWGQCGILLFPLALASLPPPPTTYTQARCASCQC